MPRNMSFHLTTQAVRAQIKTVTRRLGWDFLKPGDIVNACVKCQGLGKGGKIERICQIRIVSVEKQPLWAMLANTKPAMEEPAKEGFPGMSQADFVDMFCKHMKCEMRTEVNRIEFEYL